MESSELQMRRLDHLGIAAGICNESGLIELINAHIIPTRRNMSVGQEVQTMVLSSLGFVDQPLYPTPSFSTTSPWIYWWQRASVPRI